MAGRETFHVCGAARRRRAFTLIELLVVVAIISLLVTILLPSLQRAKNAAESAVCSSRLRGLAACMAFYAEANNDRYPYNRGAKPYAHWSMWNRREMVAYGMPGTTPARNQYRLCPSARRLGLNGWSEPSYVPGEETGMFSYVANLFVLTLSNYHDPSGTGQVDAVPWAPETGYYSSRYPYWSFPTDAWETPAESPMIMDGQSKPIGMYEAIQPVTLHGYIKWSRLTFLDQIGTMHAGKAGNFVFMDHHVESVPYREGPPSAPWQWYRDAFIWLPRL